MTVPILDKKLEGSADEAITSMVRVATAKFAKSKADNEPWSSALAAFTSSGAGD